ncbi:MAG: MerR family transcriptional regulator [Candidatus Sedimenticola endophacoides]
MTSVEKLEATGISRATLNNYIALGLLPRPQVRQPEGEVKTRARQIGYFPADTIDRINAIQALKRDGLSLSEIAERMGQENLAGAPSPAPNVAMVEETGALRLTVQECRYLVKDFGDWDVPKSFTR